MNYYNEIDPVAADWIEELIKDELIPYGKVDRRSIRDVQPGDLEGFVQCHFFAGISGFALALRLAGWPADRPIFTGSCPCQPFSCAGKGGGRDDQRHLWPDFFRLISACRPDLVIGEQVSSALVVGKAGQEFDAAAPVWVDGIKADLESIHYAFGAADIPAAGVNAPHRRQRLYWVAMGDATCEREKPAKLSRQSCRSQLSSAHGSVADAEHDGRRSDQPRRGSEGRTVDGRDSETGGLADTECCGHRNQRNGKTGRRESECCCQHERLADTPSRGQRTDGGASGATGHAEQREQAEWMGDTPGSGRQGGNGSGEQEQGPGTGRSGRGMGYTSGEGFQVGIGDGRLQREEVGASEGKTVERRGDNFWSDSIWHECRDGKARRIPADAESVFQRMVAGAAEGMDVVRIASYGFPLAPKIQGRVGLLKGYGNCLCVPMAAEFIRSVMEIIDHHDS